MAPHPEAAQAFKDLTDLVNDLKRTCGPNDHVVVAIRGLPAGPHNITYKRLGQLILIHAQLDGGGDFVHAFHYTQTDLVFGVRDRGSGAPQTHGFKLGGVKGPSATSTP